MHSMRFTPLSRTTAVNVPMVSLTTSPQRKREREPYENEEDERQRLRDYHMRVERLHAIEQRSAPLLVPLLSSLSDVPGLPAVPAADNEMLCPFTSPDMSEHLADEAPEPYMRDEDEWDFERDLPAEIVDNDFQDLFVDRYGHPHRIEIRGDRSNNVIFFNAITVGEAFGFDGAKIKRKAQFVEGEHFVLIRQEDPTQSGAKRIQRRRVPYLTLLGLHQALFSLLASELKDGYLYLVYLGGNRFKYGLSTNIGVRMDAHDRIFKIANYKIVKLIYKVKIDRKHLFTAECILRSFLRYKRWHRSTRTSKELCELANATELQAVKAEMDRLHNEFFSNSADEKVTVPKYDQLQFVNSLRDLTKSKRRSKSRKL